MSSYSSLPGCRTSSRSKKPSNYAKYIEEYQKQIIPKSIKKSRAELQSSSQNQQQQIELQRKQTKNTLKCVMSDGKRLNLQIIFTKTNNCKIKQKNKEKVIEEKILTQKKTKVQDNNLLSKFLFAFQEIQKGQKQVEDQNQKINTYSSQIQIQPNKQKKQPKQLKRKQKDQDDKCTKFYQKMKKLDQKFLEVSETLVLL